MGKNPERGVLLFLSCHRTAAELQASPSCTPLPTSRSVFEIGRVMAKHCEIYILKSAMCECKTDSKYPKAKE